MKEIKALGEKLKKSQEELETTRVEVSSIFLYFFLVMIER